MIRLSAQRLALLNDPDTYLHIAVGRWIWTHQTLPFHDPFSSSMAGAAWIPHEWLAEFLLAGIYQVSGWAGLILLTTACVAASLTVLTRRLLAHFEPLSGMIVVVTAGAMLLPHVLVRPHALAFPLLVIWSAGLIGARDADRPPPWRLLPIMALWANLHGGFMAGLALALFLGCEATIDAPAEWRLATGRRWSLFLLLAIVAALLTPNGFQGLLQPFRISSMPVLQATFVEWRHIDFMSFQMIYLWIIAVAVLSLTGNGPRLTRLALFAILCAAALQHQRHLDLVAVIGSLAIAASMGPRLAAIIRSEPPSSIARGATLLNQPSGRYAMMSAVSLILMISVVSLALPIHRENGSITPSNALIAVHDHGIGGPVFNDEGFGGFLVWSGVPTFIDGRIEMYGDAFLAQYLKAEAGEEPALDDLLDRCKIGWVLLTPASGATAALAHRADWHRIYGDSVAVVYARGSS